MKTITLKVGLAAVALFCAGPAMALDYQFDDINITINNRFTSGISVRMQNPSNDLIGKTNVPGQQNLCTADSCISLTGDPAPNQRLVNAPGAFSGVNADNGDLNYKRYDIVNANNRLSSDMTVKYGDFLTRVRGIAYYDPINTGFDEHHNDTRFQPASTSRTSKVDGLIGKGFDLYDAYGQYEFQWSGRNAAVSVGYQTVRWGESTLIARNAIAEINSPSSIVLHTPGFEINEVFRPVPAFVLSTDLFTGVSAEFFYQLKWQKIQADPAGSFFGDQDLLDGTFAAVSLGQFGEDPNKVQRINGPISLISSTSATTYLDPAHEARDMGQYGVRINYNAEWLNDGTELGFYFLNYHSRYPYASASASDASCTRGPVGQAAGGANVVTALVDCQGFNGSLLGRSDQHNPEREPLPVDSFRAYLEYPENIQMYGISFNTNAFGLSFAGEYSFRPNLPLQVSITDVIFTGLQPAFPGNSFAVDPTGLNDIVTALTGLGVQTIPLGNLTQLAGSHFPSADIAVPSYLRQYRHLGPIQAHQVIPGYERFAVGQFDLTAIKAFSSNPFGADQIILISEVGFTQIFGLPDKSQLQIEGGGPNRTHASQGQDQNTTLYAHLNPHQQTEGFADRFAWGVRSIIKGEYNDVVFGWNFRPTIILQWDIGGIAPFPIQNFVEGRKQADIGTDINITQSFSTRLNYEIFTGGGRENTYKDRDNMSISFAYAF